MLTSHNNANNLDSQNRPAEFVTSGNEATNSKINYFNTINTILQTTINEPFNKFLNNLTQKENKNFTTVISK